MGPSIRRWCRRLAGLTLVLAASGGHATAGPCLVPGLAPEVLTPAGSTIDQLGGVVVGAVSFAGGSSADPVGAPWQFTDAGKAQPARITRLAPGLVTYAPVTPGMGVALALEDRPGHAAVKVTLTFVPVDDMPVNAAPRPSSIAVAPSAPMFRTQLVTATLREPPPAGTIALVVRAANSKSSEGRSWVMIGDPRATTLEIYMRDRCAPEIPGTVATKAGDEIVLAWVDVGGHVSLWSQPMRVTAPRPPARPARPKAKAR